MRVQELFEGRRPDLLDRLDRGPTAQKIADEQRAEIIEPPSDWRKIGVQPCRHPSADPCAVIDQATAGLHEIVAHPRLGSIRPPGLEPISMMHEQIEPIVGIPRLSLGSAGRERFTRLGQRGGVERGEDKEVVCQERLAQWATRRL
jgi:hypothetical protein